MKKIKKELIERLIFYINRLKVNQSEYSYECEYCGEPQLGKTDCDCKESLVRNQTIDEVIDLVKSL